MQNYYIRIEDMPSLVSHKLSIIKYVVLKKIIFTFSVLTVSFGLGLDLDSNLFGLGLDLDSNLFGLGLDSDSNLFGLGLVLDKGGLDYSPTSHTTEKPKIIFRTTKVIGTLGLSEVKISPIICGVYPALQKTVCYLRF